MKLDLATLPPHLRDLNKHLFGAEIGHAEVLPAPEKPAKPSESVTPTAQVFAQFCARMGIPLPDAEYKFHETRKWRFDYAWPSLRLALEVDGGVWKQGRHTRGSGFVKDMEKFNAAAMDGWRVLRVQPRDLITTATADMIRTALKAL